MPKNRNKIKFLAMGGGSVLALGVTAMVLLSGHASQAQDKATTDKPTDTATVRPSLTNQTVVTSKAAPQATDPRVEAARAEAAKADAAKAEADRAALAKQQAATNNNNLATNTQVRPQGPVLLRRPMAPARVQWSSAMSQSSRMKSVRKPNNLASRLPRAQLDRTRLPVILPREGFIDTAKAKMVTFGDAYALNMPQSKGTQITMYGNRSFVPGDKGSVSSRPVQKLAGMVEDVRISQMEDGWTATFTRYGVVYSIDVSCDEVTSPDCQNDTYIRNTIAQFDDVTMGADAQAEATKDSEPKKSPSLLDKVNQTISKITKGG